MHKDGTYQLPDGSFTCIATMVPGARTDDTRIGLQLVEDDSVLPDQQTLQAISLSSGEHNQSTPDRKK